MKKIFFLYLLAVVLGQNTFANPVVTAPAGPANPAAAMAAAVAHLREKAKELEDKTKNIMKPYIEKFNTVIIPMVNAGRQAILKKLADLAEFVNIVKQNYLDAVKRGEQAKDMETYIKEEMARRVEEAKKTIQAEIVEVKAAREKAALELQKMDAHLKALETQLVELH